LAVLVKQEAAAQADADAARANKRPDVSVELSYSQRGPAYSNMVSVGVSIPLQWDQKNRQDRELGAKLAVVEQLRAQREDETRMHVAEVRTLLQQWRSDRDRVVRYDAELLPWPLIAPGRRSPPTAAVQRRSARARCAPRRDRHLHGEASPADERRATLGATELPDPRRPWWR
jgi:hypothetical protein